MKHMSIFILFILNVFALNAQDEGFGLWNHKTSINPNMQCRFFMAGYDFDTHKIYDDSSYAHWYKPDIKFLLNDSGSAQAKLDMDNNHTFKAIRDAFNEWNTNTASWFSITEGDSTTSIRKAVDSLNVVQWTTDLDILEEPNVSGIAWFTADTTGRIYDCDLFFNDSASYWDYTISDWALSTWHCPHPDFGWGDTMIFAQHLDLQSIATHEIGHMFGLGHGVVDLYVGHHPYPGYYFTNPSSMVPGIAWSSDTSYSRRCNYPDGWYDVYQHQAFEMRSIEYWDTAGVNFLYGNILNVPYVFSKVQEAASFADSGQRITLVWGYDSTIQCNIQDVVTEKTVLKPHVFLDITWRTSMIIEDTLIVEPGARIKLVGKHDYPTDSMPTIVFRGNGLLIVRDPLGLQGIGKIIDANIRWESDFFLPETDSLNMITRDTSAYYVMDSSFNATIEGKLVFTTEYVDRNHIFQFAHGSQIILNRHDALMESRDSVNLTGIPDIFAYPNTTIRGVGLPGLDNASTWWSFADSCGITSYGTVDMRYCYMGGSTYIGWKGVVCAGDSSFLSLFETYVSSIMTGLSQTAYAAVALYGTGSERPNYITRSKIVRNSDSYANSGVYLLPGYTADGSFISSYIIVDTTCFYNHWMYGILDYECSDLLRDSRIFENYTGLYNYGGNSVLRGNCINGNYWYGIHGTSSGAINFYNGSPSNAVNNAIKYNGDAGGGGVNIFLEEAARLNDGYFNTNNPPEIQRGRNAIVNYPGLLNVAVFTNAEAHMQGNYWGEPPNLGGPEFGTFDANQMAAMFYDGGADTIDVDSALFGEPDETMGCEANCDVLSTMQGMPIVDFSASATSAPAPFFKQALTPSGFRQQMNNMRNYARNGNFPAAYGIAQSLLAGASNSSDAYAIAGSIYELETERLRTYPDSLERCMRRVGMFFDGQLQSNNGQSAKNAARFFLAKTYARYTDLSSANSTLNTLISNNPAVHLKKSALLLKQNIAMVLRDTAQVEQTLASLYAIDSSANETAIAASARQIFYRLRDQSVRQRTLNLQKYSHEQTSVAIPREITLEQNNPNPFNPSTEITYGIPEETQVKLTVYDQLGREVKTLVNGTKSAGTYTVTFDAGDLPSGMYLYRIETKHGTVSKKMLLAK